MSTPTTTDAMTADVARMLRQYEVEQFLNLESKLLDDNDLDGWLTLLTEDVRYVMPVRSTRYGRTTDEFSTRSFVFNDDLHGLKMRVARLHTRFAWAEDPPSRNRHFVSNVVVEDEQDGVLRVRSNVLLYRSRLADAEGEIFTGERRDEIRRTPDGLRLARRTVYMDQTVLGLSAVTTFI